MITFAVFLRKYTRKIIFGLLFFLITILPVLQLIPVGNAITADRFTYVPLIGLFYLVGEGFSWLYDKRFRFNNVKKIALVIFVSLIIGILSFLTWQRCHIWKNSITLWTDVLDRYPNTLIASYSRGLAFYNINNYDQAIIDFTQTIRLRPDMPEAYMNRGNSYAYRKQYKQAIVDFNQAIKIKPDYADAYYNRALAYYLMKDYGRAWRDVEKLEKLGYQVNPDFLQNLIESSVDTQ
jgi:tetratricopeptide (TPR) repeat protein